MRPEAARTLLGVAAGASADEVRRAYRERLRATHPDLNGGSAAAVVDVVEAYRTLVALGGAPADVDPAPTEPAPAPAPAVPGRAVHVEGDTVTADLPAGDLFELLVAVGDSIGDLTHVDHDAGLLEILVRFAGYGPCSVVLSLQGRATGTTEAWCTVETFSGGPPPPVERVAELLAAGLRTAATPPPAAP